MTTELEEYISKQINSGVDPLYVAAVLMIASREIYASMLSPEDYTKLMQTILIMDMEPDGKAAH